MNTSEFKLFLAKDWSIRASAAKSLKTSKEIFEILAKDKDSWIRSLVTQNPNTPKEILEILAKDESLDVRASVTKALRI